MANLWGNRARRHYREYLPGLYRAIPDKETFFRELGQTAATQIETVYRQLARPELGNNDAMARMQAEETVTELVYPTPEPGHEDGWETATEPISPTPEPGYQDGWRPVRISEEEYQALTEQAGQTPPG